MADEVYVGVAEPGTPSQKIRNLQVTVLQADETTADVTMQVVSVADERGQLLNLDLAGALQELINEVRQLRKTVEFIHGVSL